MHGGVASKMARGYEVARKNLHPSFALTKRHLWKARWKVFSSSQAACSLFFLCFTIVFVDVLGRFRNPRGLVILLFDDNNSSPSCALSFPRNILRISTLCCNHGMRYKGKDNMNFSRHCRRAYHFALHLVRFRFWIIPRHFSVVTFYCLPLDILYARYGNILHPLWMICDISTSTFFKICYFY